MMRRVLRLALVVVVVALTTCSRENVGEQLTRECGEIVDAESDSADTTTAAPEGDTSRVSRAGNVTRVHCRQVRRRLGPSGQQRRRARCDMRAAFDNDLPRRARLRQRKIRESVSNRETKEGVR